MKKLLAAAMLAIAMLPAHHALAWGDTAPLPHTSSFVRPLSVQAPQQADAPSAAGRTAATEDGTSASAGKWRGMVGGVLANLGLGALLSQLGIGGVLGGVVALVLVIALVAFILTVVFRLARRQEQDLPPMREPVLANGHAAAGGAARSGMRAEPHAMPRAAPAAAGQGAPAWGIPADFDVPGFLRNAKAHFIRLQASWDKSDVNDIREFTTTEMFAELTLQLHERGVAGQTNVAILNAELLGVESTGTEYVASVKFSGMIKESGHPMAEPFIEIWSLTRPVAGQGGWLLAGIQQLQ